MNESEINRLHDIEHKYNTIRDHLWYGAVHGNPMQSAIFAALIRLYEIEGPNGEAPEDA